ncbi:MAG: sulfite exporter TauE/SafE family protein [Polyangiaceae bacterium]|nr:sulfite exporter TauE/SafE family protein [Polyangiaceae bacterium]
MIFFILVGVAGMIMGGVASVAGFGIGSVLTPLVATQYGMKLAVALVAIPHFAATLLRAWRLRRDVDRTVLLRFGIASAAGGLTGAILHNRVKSNGLAIVLGCLLVFAGITGVAGLSQRLRFGRRTAWVAGILSGGLGGLVGNQGGIRSAALMGFDVRKEAFVATATAIGVVVDLARLPIYLTAQGREILAAWPLVAVATGATLTGTLAGESILRRIPERTFRMAVSLIILGLGIAVLGGVAHS